MANDPTLNRPMFTPAQSTPPLRPMVSPGISALPRPDVEAQNLRNLFAPTQPVQTFRGGGEVINGVKHFQVGGLNNISPDERARVQDREARRQFDIDDTESRSRMGSPNMMRNPSLSESYPRRPPFRTGGPPVERTPMDVNFGMPMEGGQMYEMSSGIGGSVQAPPAPRAPVDMFTGPGGGERYSNDPARPVVSQLGERAAPPPPPDTRPPVKPQGELELSLEAIRSRRAEDRKENALLALMQAGFATAAGRSPSALTNIGTGGQAGIAAFAGMERASREDQRAAMQDLAMRRREMSAENLAREKLAQDPDIIRTARILGKGDVERGLAVLNADKKLQAAIAISKDLTADEGARREAVQYLQRSIQNAGVGGGNMPPAGSTIIPLNQLTRPPAR